MYRSEDCEAFNAQLPHSSLFERPWAGGLDTFHSQLYVERFGTHAFDRLKTQATHMSELWLRTRVASFYDLNAIFETSIIHQALKNDCGRDTLRKRLGSDLERATSTLWTTACKAKRQEYVLSFRAFKEP